jgi:protein-tyrosine phosphatase
MEGRQGRNWRDVGVALHRLTGLWVVPKGRLFRCGTIDYIPWTELGSPATIINLRMMEDKAQSLSLPQASAVQLLHFPVANNLDKYNTNNKEIREWLVKVIQVFEHTHKDEDDRVQTTINYPVLIHCLAGRDRTGVLVAVLLRILGVEEEIVVQEFMLSAEAKESDIRRALLPFRDNSGIERYFKRYKVCLQKVRANLCLDIAESV